MSLTREEEIEFLFLTRHLKHNDLDVQIDIAKHASEQMANGEQLQHPNALKAYAFVRDIALAAQKYPKNLQEEYGLTHQQISICIEIKRSVEKVKLNKDDTGLFKRAALFNKSQFENLFKKFISKIDFRKTPR
jgi:hypothetical protein